jgi:hypothetical protein
MARPRKDDVSPLTKIELVSAAARLHHICDSIETVARNMENSDVLFVSYAKSLTRGLQSLEAVEPEIRRSMTMHKLGQPILPTGDVPQKVAELPGKYRGRKTK